MAIAATNFRELKLDRLSRFALKPRLLQQHGALQARLVLGTGHLGAAPRRSKTYVGGGWG